MIGIRIRLGALLACGLGLGALVPSAQAQQGAWTQKAPMPAVRGEVAAAAVGDKLYAIGGGVAGSAVPRKEILEKVWGVHEDTDTRAIDNFIVRLRRYIKEEPSNPRHLQTVRGVGYRFVANPR